MAKRVEDTVLDERAMEAALSESTPTSEPLGEETGPAPAAAPKNGATTALTKPEEKPAVAVVPIDNGVLRPGNFDGLYRMARLVFASNIAPKGAKTVEQVFIAMAAGLEVGLSPMQSIRNVMVVNNTPSIWGDAALALVQSSGNLEDISETVDDDGEKMIARCLVKRKGRTTPTERSFSVADAKRAGLWGKQGPWTQYPKRMLQLRARAFALRDSFPDFLMGVGIAEENEDIQGAKAEDLTNRINALST